MVVGLMRTGYYCPWMPRGKMQRVSVRLNLLASWCHGSGQSHEEVDRITGASKAFGELRRVAFTRIVGS